MHILVETYSGYKADEYPKRITIGENQLEVIDIGLGPSDSMSLAFLVLIVFLLPAFILILVGIFLAIIGLRIGDPIFSYLGIALNTITACIFLLPLFH